MDRFARDQVIGYVRDFRARSERYSASFKKQLPRYYELWRGLYTGTASITKHDVHLPLIFSTIQTLVARQMATEFGQFPFVNFMGAGPDDAPIARKNDALFAAQFRDARGLRKEYTNILRGELYGRSVARTMWDHKEEIQTREAWKALPLSGDRVRQIQRARVVTFDGPNYELVDLLDCFPWPGFMDEHDMPGYAVRYYMTLDQAEFMASDAGGNVFDRSEIERLKRDNANAAFYRAVRIELRSAEPRLFPQVPGNTLPNCSFIIEPAVGPYRVNTSVLFQTTSSDLDGTIVRYAWTFGDGTTSDQPDEEHHYAAAGTYTVEHGVTDDDGGQATCPQTVEIIN